MAPGLSIGDRRGKGRKKTGKSDHATAMIVGIAGVVMIALITMIGPSSHNVMGSATYIGFGMGDKMSLEQQSITYSSATEEKAVRLSVQDDAIYNTAYISRNGNDWEPVQLMGAGMGNGWIRGAAIAEIKSKAESFGLQEGRSSEDNYLIAYSCSRMQCSPADNKMKCWDCHGGQWQIEQFNVSYQHQQQQTSPITITATASSFEDVPGSYRPPQDSIDGDTSTRWSASGDQWIRYDFSSPVTMSAINIQFLAGDSRKAYLDISVSGDGTSFEQVFSGSSSGSSAGPERFSFSPRTVKAVRIDGSGNSQSTWNSYVEVTFETQEQTTAQTGNQQPADACANIDCDDNDECTTDSCDAGVCSHTTITGCGATTDPCAGISCDDGDACTTDSCDAGVCSHTTITGCGASMGEEKLLASGFENGVLEAPYLSSNCLDLQVTDTKAYAGRYSLKVTNVCDTKAYTTPDSRTEGNVLPLSSDALVRYTVRYYADTPTAGALTMLCLGDDGLYWGHSGGHAYTTSGGEFTATNKWQQKTLDFTCPGWARGVGVRVSTDVAGGTIYIDNPTIQAVATYGNTCEVDSNCDDGDARTSDTCTGTPRSCSHEAVTSCQSFDNYCPAGCSITQDIDCAKSLKDMPFTLKSASDYSKAVYIDPSISSPGDGSSPSKALKSWDDVSFSANTAYLQKRGTTSVISHTIRPDQDNVLLGAYGTGNRPIIDNGYTATGDSTIVGIAADHVTVRDLEFSAAGVSSGVNVGRNRYAVVYNNVIHDSGWGIRGYADGFRILNNEVYDIYEDGMFFKSASYVEIGNNDVHDVNLNWHEPYTSQKEAGGDAVQFSGVSNWWVHHNTLDRTNSGNKFCFIANFESADPPSTNYGLFEYNTIAGPKTSGDGGSSLYIGGGQDDQYIYRYNTISAPSPVALYSHSRLQFYGNTIKGLSSNLVCSGCDVHDNTYT